MKTNRRPLSQDASDPASRGEAAVARDEEIARIARDELSIMTFKEYGCDRLDFFEVTARVVRRALEAAYDAGARSQRA